MIGDSLDGGLPMQAWSVELLMGDSMVGVRMVMPEELRRGPSDGVLVVRVSLIVSNELLIWKVLIGNSLDVLSEVSEGGLPNEPLRACSVEFLIGDSAVGVRTGMPVELQRGGSENPVEFLRELCVGLLIGIST